MIHQDVMADTLKGKTVAIMVGQEEPLAEGPLVALQEMALQMLRACQPSAINILIWQKRRYPTVTALRQKIITNMPSIIAKC